MWGSGSGRLADVAIESSTLFSVTASKIPVSGRSVMKSCSQLSVKSISDKTVSASLFPSSIMVNTLRLLNLLLRLPPPIVRVPLLRRSSQPPRDAIDTVDIVLLAPSTRGFLMAAADLSLLTGVASRADFDASRKGHCIHSVDVVSDSSVCMWDQPVRLISETTMVYIAACLNQPLTSAHVRNARFHCPSTGFAAQLHSRFCKFNSTKLCSFQLALHVPLLSGSITTTRYER